VTIVCAELARGREGVWDAFVGAHPDATFFHRSGWRQVIERSFGHATHYLMAERDGAVVGVLPLGHVTSPLFGKSLISVPFGVYGGPLAADEEALTALEAASRAVMAQIGVKVMEWRALGDPGPLRPGWQERADLYVTFRKPMTADDDTNLKAIPRKQRAMVRKGIDRGLTSVANQDMRMLYPIYAESVRNLGTPVFSRRYFEILAEVFGADLDVVTVFDADVAVASVMNFYWRSEVIPYYGGGKALARECYGNDFMYWEVMRRAAARGCTIFDFGRSKAGTGSFAFKKNWGFVPAPLRYRFCLAEGVPIPETNPLNPKYRLMIATWKRLPLPVANLIGPFIVKGVG
jgi:FemAB-related protein (PEP-CTERM system-associated)